MTESKGGFLISQIKQIQGRVFEKLLLRAGVEEFNGAQGRILFVLWQEDAVPIVALSKRTGLAKTTLTSMLDRLEQAGLVARSYDGKDRRKINIALTDKARELEAAYSRVSAQMTKLFYKGFSESEIEQFELNLNRILKNLNESEDQLC